jgi:hypothetical protein
VVFSGLTYSNKVAIGRVLPVFLAILFVGSSDQSLFAAYPSLDAQPSCANGNSRSKRAFYGDARVALRLLPALLNQTCRTGHPSTTLFSSPSRHAQLASGTDRYDLLSTRRKPLETFHTHDIWQRPPPSV